MKVGDRVVFANNRYDYTIASFNPLVGTEYFCVGTITHIGNHDISVKWDNLETNGYDLGCLEIYDPKKHCGLVKIRRTHPLTKIFV